MHQRNFDFKHKCHVMCAAVSAHQESNKIIIINDNTVFVHSIQPLYECHSSLRQLGFATLLFAAVALTSCQLKPHERQMNTNLRPR